MISYYAILSIIKFRLREFLFEFHYTIIAPIISNLIFVIIFSTIQNYYSITINNSSYIEFLIPGLIVMIVVQESFDNTSASIINMKQIGSFNDFLFAPLSRIELFISFLISSLLIGIFLGLINFAIFSYFVDFSNFSLFFFIYYLCIAIIFFACLGCAVGFLSYTWDTQSTFSNFFVTPLNFLSGTFFSINSLPESLKFLFLYNPYYYVVSYFRSSFYNSFKFSFIENFYIFILVILSLITTGIIFLKGYKVIR